jgi:putative aminopeptidase FrvX
MPPRQVGKQSKLFKRICVDYTSSRLREPFMNQNQLLRIAREVFIQPTAPLHEDAIKDVVQRFCRARPQLRFTQDRWGNLVVTYRKGTGTRPVAFEAHTDHPGFEILQDSDGGRVAARFLGGVRLDFFKGSRARIFCHSSGAKPVEARKPGGVRAVVASVNRKTWHKEKHVTLTVDGPVRRGDFGMWDLNPFAIRNGKLYTRACDDLIGCVGMLAVLDEFVRRGTNGHVIAVFTRAEEMGFLGALALARDGMIPSAAIVVGLEASRELPAGKMGNGPIIRVGDHTSVFSSEVTFFLTEVALRLKAKNRKFAFQRALMDGGTCNSTIYHQQGYRAGAVCLALGNYHNHGPNGKIAPEYVSLSDLNLMVDFLSEIAREASQFDEIADSLNRRLNRLYAVAKKQLQPARKPARSRST